jgi:hypothetical protein
MAVSLTKAAKLAAVMSMHLVVARQRREVHRVVHHCCLR